MGLLKSVFITVLVFLSNLAGKNSLISISMNNQEFKARPQIVNFNGDDPAFFPSVLKQVNAVPVATIPIIHAQNCFFLMV